MPHNSAGLTLNHSAPTVLLTRPKAQSLDFARLLVPAHTVISPVTQVVFMPIPDTLAGKILIVTSSNALQAVRHAGISIKGRSIYCVGLKTAKIAEDLGANVLGVADTANHLVTQIIRRMPKESLLYLRGQEISTDIAKSLLSAGLDTDEAVVYGVKPQALSRQVMDLVRSPQTVIMPLFSVRSAIRLSEQLPQVQCRIVLVPISQNVADAWQGPEPAVVTVANQPSSEAMVRAIKSHMV